MKKEYHHAEHADILIKTHEDSNMKRTFYMDLLRPIGIDIVNVYGYVRYNITARAISPLNNYGE